MDSKEGNDVRSPILTTEMLLELQQNIVKAISDKKASVSSAPTSTKFQNLSRELTLHLLKTANAKDPKNANPSKATSHIRFELDKVFDHAEEVGHSCDLCQGDLASDPERPNASLGSLQEVCVLACGHVYHYKCLSITTLDLDNRFTNPSCIFCSSYSS